MVVGSRGLGSIQSNVMGLFGLGSVSDYLVSCIFALIVAPESKTLLLSLLVVAVVDDEPCLQSWNSKIYAREFNYFGFQHFRGRC